MDDREELVDCQHCLGSGEGKADGTRCPSCGGSGVERQRLEDDGIEPDEIPGRTRYRSEDEAEWAGVVWP